MNKIEEFLNSEDHGLYDKYSQLATGFEKIHASVVSGAATHDGGLLTDHGPNHIARVGEVASDLLGQIDDDLSPYEAFLLLVSIQIHDIANILGRENHEKRIGEVWREVFGELGYDALDKSLAIRIASAHGGKYEGGKATLRGVDPTADWKGHSVRPQMIAAILKLSDELAEEIDRGSRELLHFGSLPRESQIYHVYSLGLHTTRVEASTGSIRLSFAAAEKYFRDELGKGASSTYLLDEIYARSLKTWSECVYCSRFIPSLQISTVNVDVEIFSNDMINRLERIKYRLEDSGYPEIVGRTIFDICPELCDFNGLGKLTPDVLIRSIEGAAHREKTGDGPEPKKGAFAKLAEILGIGSR